VFVDWCSDEVTSGKGRKRAEGTLSENSVAKYIHTLKAVTNYHGFKVEYSKTEQYTTTPYYLNVNELKQIEALQIDDVVTAIYRDYFVLQCKTGLRVGDLARLTRKNIVVQGGNVCLVNNSHKTNTTTSVPLASAERLDEVIAYVERLTAYRGFCLDTYNGKIRELIKLANIDRAVVIKHGRKAEYKQLSDVATSHMARRTFVGNLYERGVDRAVITSMSGHVQDSKSLNRYFAVSEAQKAQAVKIFD
jgi:integrase